MAEEKRYEFKISASCNVEGEDSPKMFDANINYYNMKYEDVVLVEKHVLGVFQGLNQYAEEKEIPSKKNKGE